MEKKANPCPPPPEWTSITHVNKHKHRSKTTWAGSLPTCPPTRTQTIRGVSSSSPERKYQTCPNPSICPHAPSRKVANHPWHVTLAFPGNLNCPLSFPPSRTQAAGWGRRRMDTDKTLPTFRVAKNNNRGWHLLSTYHEPDTVLSTFKKKLLI